MSPTQIQQLDDLIPGTPERIGNGEPRFISIDVDKQPEGVRKVSIAFLERRVRRFESCRGHPRGPAPFYPFKKSCLYGR